MLGTVMTTLSAVVTVTVLQLVTGPTRPDFPEHGKRLVLAVAFLSVALVVGTVSALFNWAFNHCVSQLTHGLKAVAEGDFSIRLDPERAGPLAGAYQDFNKMTEGLQGVQTLRSGFINNFSHEFKTPITAIKGFAELLREPDTTPRGAGAVPPDHSGRVLPPGRPGQQHPAAHQAGVPAVHRGEAPLLSGRADQAVRHPPLPRLGEKADIFHRQPGAGGVRGQ